MKHTPGPWSFIRDNHIGLKFLDEEISMRVIYRPGKEDVAYIPPNDSDNGNANARLIAAAPELLEACNHALPLLKHLNKFLKYQRVGHEFYPAREDGDGAIDKLSIAIAKAETI